MTNLNQQLYEALESREIFRSLNLIVQGANVNAQNELGETLLHLILEELYSDIEYNFADEDIEFCAIDLPSDILLDDDKINLINAINYLMIEQNASLLCDENGNTPLHKFSGIIYAHLTFEQQAHVAKILTSNIQSDEINYINNQGVTAFALAVFHNTPQAQYLAQIPNVDINKGAREDFSYDFQWGLTDEMWSKIEGNKWTNEYFDGLPKGYTPLMVASLFDNRAVLNALVERDDLRPVGRYFQTFSGSLIEILPGETSIHLAVVNNNIESLKFLLAKMSPHALLDVNNQGHTILHKACHYKHHEIIKFLLNKEVLNSIFLEHELDDSIYVRFVNYESKQGKAATCYNSWHSTYAQQLEDDYLAFLKCEEYEVFKVDARGNSLFHIILFMGYESLVDIAMERDDFPEKAFSQKNAYGHSAIKIAIDSDNPELIRKLADLSYERRDIDPNKMERFFYNLRNRLVDFYEEGWFSEEAIISGLNVDVLLDIYLKTKESYKMYAVFKEKEIVINVTVEPTSLDSVGLPELEESLETNIILVLKHYMQLIEDYGYAYCTDLPKLSDEFQDLRDVVEKAYDENSQYESGMFKFTYHNREITVKYETGDTDLDVVHEVEICYQDVISGMGDEWDYVERDSDPKEGVLYKTHQEINFIPYVPLLYFILKKIHDAVGSDVDKEIEKLKAFLEFPFLLNEQFTSIVQDGNKALTNIYDYAPEQVKPLLLEKIRAQDALSHRLDDLSIAGDVPIHDYVLSYEQIELAGNPYLILKEGERLKSDVARRAEFPVRLYEFAMSFFYRINTVLQSESPTYRSTDKFLSLLDSMSRLFEVDSMCIAISYIEEKFIISSNYGSMNMTQVKRQAIYNKLNSQIVPGILQHLANFSSYTQVEKESNSLHILNLVVPSYVDNIRSYPQKAKKIMEQLTDQILGDLIKFFYINNIEILKRIKRSEDEADNTTYMFSDVLEYTKDAFPIFNAADTDGKKKDVCNFIYRIYRLCKDLRNLEEGVISQYQDKLLPEGVLKVLNDKDIEDLYLMVPNDNFVHTESALLDYVIENHHTFSKLHIGVSRICCPLCTLFVQSINHKLCEESFIYTHGSHQNTPVWPLPKILIQDMELLALVLGGETSKTYNIFMRMSEAEKYIALKLLQGINIKNLKDNSLDELAKILIKPTSQHPLPEPSLSIATDDLVHIFAEGDEVAIATIAENGDVNQYADMPSLEDPDTGLMGAP